MPSPQAMYRFLDDERGRRRDRCESTAEDAMSHGGWDPDWPEVWWCTSCGCKFYAPAAFVPASGQCPRCERLRV